MFLNVLTWTNEISGANPSRIFWFQAQTKSHLKMTMTSWKELRNLNKKLWSSSSQYMFIFCLCFLGLFAIMNGFLEPTQWSKLVRHPGPKEKRQLRDLKATKYGHAIQSFLTTNICACTYPLGVSFLKVRRQSQLIQRPRNTAGRCNLRKHFWDIFL